MSVSGSEQAKREINQSLQLCKICTIQIGVSLDPPKTKLVYFLQGLLLVTCVISVCFHLFGDFMFVVVQISSSPQIEDVVPFLHTFGFAILSLSKLFALWYKRDVFTKLIRELIDIWPVSPPDEESQEIKNSYQSALRITSLWYFLINSVGVWFYYATPIFVYMYKCWQGQYDAQIGFIWYTWYPFDKHQSISYIFVYIFEMFIGQTCMWATIGTDLLFSAMASHISLLLRLLQRRLEAMGASEENLTTTDCYDEIVENIKLHQRLIRYCEDLEDAFSLSNLFNYILSSINICCVVFVIALLEPFTFISNKLFLTSALIQIGMICWYGESILQANAEIANAAYNSGWYRMDPKCRRALLFLIRRAQKPIAFTAMKFTDISLKTYATTLRRSYSYFALLYSIYSK